MQLAVYLSLIVFTQRCMQGQLTMKGITYEKSGKPLADYSPLTDFILKGVSRNLDEFLMFLKILTFSLH